MRATWLRMLTVGVVAWLAHGAAFATAFIAVELVMCGVLLFTARKIGTMS